MPAERRIGLARVLSKAGYCSRSKAFELIRESRVQLNGRVRRDPETPVDMRRDAILIDGHPLQDRQKIYLMLNKPRGLVTTAADEKGRETVYNVLGREYGWLAPVGRLDKASEGLLLLTNDSEWAAGITAPESHIKKTYRVQIDRVATEDLIASLERGVQSNGENLRVKSARIVRAGTRTSWLEIILDEGRNRHIRRMLTALEVDVLRLIRVAIGTVTLGDLSKGKVRELTESEQRALGRSTSMNSAVHR